MKLALAAVALGALLASAPPAGARPAALKVTLTAPGHSPQIGKRWVYSVRATAGGKPAAGRITVQIVDPLGSAHPVDYGTTKKPIAGLPFKGVFRDFVLWPGNTRGVPLRFRVTVVSGGAKRTIDYPVTPHS